MSNNLTVSQYVLARLADLGITKVFGVPGDYTFPIDAAIESTPNMEFVLSSNELNAAYAADGYARVFGAGALTTTYGVGELSALNGVMGSKSQRLPIFHLVGAPSIKIQKRKLVTHHVLSDGVFNNFKPLSESACCAYASMTPENTIMETERLIDYALTHRMPVYISIPMDLGKMPVIGKSKVGEKINLTPTSKSVKEKLNEAITLIQSTLNASKNTVAIATSLAKQYGLKSDIEYILEKANISYFSTPADKAILDETSDRFIGVYNGNNSNPKESKNIIESADVVLEFGPIIFEDLSTDAWTDNLDYKKRLIIGDNFVKFGDTVVQSVFISDVLASMKILAIKPLIAKHNYSFPTFNQTISEEKLSSNTLYTMLQAFLKEGDTFIQETGGSMLYTVNMKMPKDSSYHVQALWGSIGWATPAVFGACMANNNSRTIMVTGDGSHQLTANEIGAMSRNGAKPIIFVINNGIYGIEEILDSEYHHYNDLAPWDYHKIPVAMGCKDWFCVKVSTVSELTEALAELNNVETAAYIEVMIPKEESAHMPDSVLHERYLDN